MGLFSKGPDRDEIIAQGLAEAEAAAVNEGGDEKEVKTGNDKVDIELTKIYAQLDSFSEIRKANADRSARLSEQMGELRGMIVDTNKAMSKVEVAATKAVDLVESVQPEKLMIEVRKQDGKIEALRANIEGNEAIMTDLMSELKKMREQIRFYKGTEQVIKLNEEVKQELANIKRMEATIERHADKVETIFLEVEKKFSEFDKFDSILKDLDGGMKKMNIDFDKMRLKIDSKEDKKEFVSIVDKFNDFEKHTTNLLKLLDERSKTVKDGLEKDFKRLKAKLERKLETGPIDLNAPDEPPPDEKRKTLGAGEEDLSGADVAGGDIKKPGIFKRLKGKIVDKSLGDGGEKKEDSTVAPSGEEKTKGAGETKEGESEQTFEEKPSEGGEAPVEGDTIEGEVPEGGEEPPPQPA